MNGNLGNKAHLRHLHSRPKNKVVVSTTLTFPLPLRVLFCGLLSLEIFSSDLSAFFFKLNVFDLCSQHLERAAG